MSHYETLMEFVLAQLPAQPVHRRIALYLALAETCGQQAEAVKLTALARSLERSEAMHQEFVFHFSQKTL